MLKKITIRKLAHTCAKAAYDTSVLLTKGSNPWLSDTSCGSELLSSKFETQFLQLLHFQFQCEWHLMYSKWISAKNNFFFVAQCTFQITDFVLTVRIYMEIFLFVCSLGPSWSVNCLMVFNRMQPDWTAPWVERLVQNCVQKLNYPHEASKRLLLASEIGQSDLILNDLIVCWEIVSMYLYCIRVGKVTYTYINILTCWSYQSVS